MSKFNDSITIGVAPEQISSLLSDLEQHPHFVPDGFKHYRYLSQELKGVGARAAIELNLLGHWLPAELEVAALGREEVRLTVVLEPARIRMAFTLLERGTLEKAGSDKAGKASTEGGARTEVRLEVLTDRRSLPFWRVRTRLKQHLRLESDVANLCGRFLSQLKTTAEARALLVPGSSASVAGPGAPEKKAEAEKSPTQKSPAEKSPTQKSPAAHASEASAARPSPAPAAPAASAAPASPAKPVAAGSAAPVAAAGRKDSPTSTSAPSPGEELVFALKVEELPPGQARSVTLGNREVAVFNVDGAFYAINNQCAHRQGPLAFGLISGKEVTCPLHSWVYDVTTGICTNIPSARVPCFDVEQRGDALYVRSTPRAATVSA